MTTLKSINAALPRFDVLRRNYMLHGTTGSIDEREFLSSAFADLDKNGNVSGITIYVSVEAKLKKHYYQESGTVEITDQIAEAIRGNADTDAKKFRAYIVREIRQRIEEAE